MHWFFPFSPDLQSKKSMKRFILVLQGFFRLELDRYFPIWNWTPSLNTTKILLWPVGTWSPPLPPPFSYILLCKQFLHRCKIFPHSFSGGVNISSLGILFVLLCHLWTDKFKPLLNFKLQKNFAMQRKEIYIFTLNQCYAAVI